MTDDKDAYEHILKPIDFGDSRPDITAVELKRAREAMGLTHTELHRMTGISRSVLFGYEAGRTVPNTQQLRLLSQALQVNPNRLVFGDDEPFKQRTGLRAIAKLRNSPAGVLAATIIFPMIFASLDEDQLESLLVLISSVIEARDKETAKRIAAFAEVFGELIGDGSPATIKHLTEMSKDPKFLDSLGKKIEDKLASMP